MKETGTVTTPPEVIGEIPLTTAERVERDRRVEEQRRHEENAAQAAEFQAQRNAAVAGESFQKSLKQQADQDELDSRNKLVSLQSALVAERSKAGSLRHEAAAAPELPAITEKIASLENELAWRPFAEARPGAIDELNRLKTLLSLWPTRKAYLQSQLPGVEANIKRTEGEIQDAKSMFTKFAEAARKFWN